MRLVTQRGAPCRRHCSEMARRSARFSGEPLRLPVNESRYGRRRPGERASRSPAMSTAAPDGNGMLTATPPSGTFGSPGEKEK